MDNTAVERLRAIVRQHGRTVWADARRLRSHLSDACPSLKKEVYVLAKAAEAGVPGELTASAGSPWEVVRGRLVFALTNDLAINEDAARWAVNAWGDVLGIRPIELTPSPPRPTAQASGPPRAVRATPSPRPPATRASGIGCVGWGALALVSLVILGGVGFALWLVKTDRPSPMTVPAGPTTPERNQYVDDVEAKWLTKDLTALASVNVRQLRKHVEPAGVFAEVKKTLGPTDWEELDKNWNKLLDSDAKNVDRKYSMFMALLGLNANPFRSIPTFLDLYRIINRCSVVESKLKTPDFGPVTHTALIVTLERDFDPDAMGRKLAAIKEPDEKGVLVSPQESTVDGIRIWTWPTSPEVALFGTRTFVVGDRNELAVILRNRCPLDQLPELSDTFANMRAEKSMVGYGRETSNDADNPVWWDGWCDFTPKASSVRWRGTFKTEADAKKGRDQGVKTVKELEGNVPALRTILANNPDLKPLTRLGRTLDWAVPLLNDPPLEQIGNEVRIKAEIPFDLSHLILSGVEGYVAYRVAEKAGKPAEPDK